MTVSPKRTSVLALDFDGVICDSLEEGLLISWNGHTSAPLDAFVEPGLEGVPAEVTDRFTRCRPFTRHLGHWLVPMKDGSVPTSHLEFTALYEQLTADEVDAFMTAAGDYRDRARQEYPDRWLAHHRVEQGLGEALTDAYIVTARDARSVIQILEAYDLGVEHTRIFASLSDKLDALRQITVTEAVEPTDVTFVDDSIENCMAAGGAGYNAWWALWGYNTPADQGLASAHGIPAVTIDALRAPLGASVT